MTKKEKRKQDQKNRQNYGDYVEKPNKFKGNEKRTQQRGGKREFDRRSGTGKRGYKYEKEGFGKGNNAKEQEDALNEYQEENKEGQE